MAEATTIAGRVLDALVTSGLITAEQLAGVRAAAPDDAEAGRALVARGLVTTAQLGTVLEEELGVPRVDLASYAPDDEALVIVPGSLARQRNVLPLFEIEGMLTVAIGDAVDIFILDELGSDLGLDIEAVLADAPAVAGAIVQFYGEAPSSAAPVEDAPFLGMAPATDDLEISAADFFEVPEETMQVIEAPTAEPSEEIDLAAESENVAQTVEEVVAAAADTATTIDLDVLAVADDRKLAVLVSDILTAAVNRGASRIHLLPYKNDFFLVFRIQGRLEKIASAPLSMQGPLIEGFKSYAKLGRVPADVPALGRLHAELGGKQLVLTVSSVPTVAGQRLVVSLSPARPNPRDFVELGMSEAESKALQAMVERGRGLLLVAAPVAGGRSNTYYSLLSHAAAVGKTVYSVERSIEYEIPAVAQVLVNPGSAVGAASYFAAGMRQDTDVLAIDAMQSVEDVHLAIEAAGLGKLVIATFAGADIVTAVRRLLDLGAEPVSLASALTLGIGQRVVRTNCPNCSVEEKSPLTAKIPGAEKGLVTKRGTGCPNCGKSGFAGATGIFEVLPFTEPVRAQIARDASASELEAAARAAGMRPMITSGLAKVRDGIISPEELDRVLRFGA